MNMEGMIKLVMELIIQKIFEGKKIGDEKKTFFSLI